METVPRVVYMPDSYGEVNGVAHTSRNFMAFAESRDLPFLCLCAGRENRDTRHTPRTRLIEFKRSRWSIPLEQDLSFDPLFFRYGAKIEAAIKSFSPDVLHITGPSELGILGAWFARKLKIPLVASWHTNVHEYAARRSESILRLLPQSFAHSVAQRIERLALDTTMRFYRRARVSYAPNEALCRLIAGKTGKPCLLMQRGIDAEKFGRRYRTRKPGYEDEVVVGFVGRLSVEKNVALLVAIQRALDAIAAKRFRFLIVGQGAEEAMLRADLTSAEFTGVLRGEALARAYANMDVFVFPSHTDTFGNVVLEALASGVPAVVTPDGGPSSIVRDGITGFVARDEGFADAVLAIVEDKSRYARMQEEALKYAQSASWASIFEGVYKGYALALGASASVAE